jgi:single-stranded DNA-binding protein
MFNKVVIVGNLTRDIELRYTPSGAAIGKSAIAATHKFTINGEKKEDTCFIDIIFFGKGAEIANQYLKKGSKLLIEGRLKFEQWTDQNRQNRSKHTISVESMEMLGSKDGEPQKNNTYQISSASQQSQVAQRKSEPQYNDVPDIDVDCVDYESQDIPF